MASRGRKAVVETSRAAVGLGLGLGLWLGHELPLGLSSLLPSLLGQRRAFRPSFTHMILQGHLRPSTVPLA